MLRWKSSLKPAAAAPATDYKATVLADNPLFYYRLGEASGTNAYDEVAAANNGIVLQHTRFGTNRCYIRRLKHICKIQGSQ